MLFLVLVCIVQVLVPFTLRSSMESVYVCMYKYMYIQVLERIPPTSKHLKRMNAYVLYEQSTSRESCSMSLWTVGLTLVFLEVTMYAVASKSYVRWNRLII